MISHKTPRYLGMGCTGSENSSEPNPFSFIRDGQKPVIAKPEPMEMLSISRLLQA